MSKGCCGVSLIAYMRIIHLWLQLCIQCPQLCLSQLLDLTSSCSITGYNHSFLRTAAAALVTLSEIFVSSECLGRTRTGGSWLWL